MQMSKAIRQIPAATASAHAFEITGKIDVAWSYPDPPAGLTVTGRGPMPSGRRRPDARGSPHRRECQ
ncbi:hypothetical protein [uncultured Jannaschia sp.]|uniref:hypothetical protein n=1 Tax=uncultured Jannaschia sp. TaxID=293347 RepID=UPI0026231C43|nr:hypothetical protein [uncultured Jannaschia sp.]